MKVLILIDRIDPNPHRDLERNPVDPAQVAKVIDSISRTGFWENLVVRPHPNQEGRYQLAHGHHRIAACKEGGVTEAELSVMDLSDYDMLCCMIDENDTQRQITPTILFNHVAAAIQEAEKCSGRRRTCMNSMRCLSGLGGFRRCCKNHNVLINTT